jgi:catalytic LigB subunit of aromatic ring-opening dioxygenase
LKLRDLGTMMQAPPAAGAAFDAFQPRAILIVSAHPRPGPRRLGPAEGHVPRRRRARAPAVHATHDPARLLELGRRLRSLRQEGVLIIGSGFMTHGLPFLTREMLFEGAVPSWSSDFDQWVADALARGHVDTLTSFHSKAPGVGYAHPTVEHYTPLFVTLGAASDAEQPVRAAIEGYMWGLSRRSFQAA